MKKIAKMLTFWGTLLFIFAMFLPIIEAQVIIGNEVYYSFDSRNSSTIISAVGNNNLEILGTCGAIAGIIGNGVNSPNPPNNCRARSFQNITITGNESRTMAFWGSLSPTGDRVFAGFGFAGAPFNNDTYYFGVRATQFFYPSDGISCTISHTFDATFFAEYQYYVTIYNGTHNNLFVNSTFHGSCEIEYQTSETRLFFYRKSNDDNVLVGSMDEFGLWNRSLNQSEIDELYNSGSGFSPYVTYTIEDVNFSANTHDTELQNFSLNLSISDITLSAFATLVYDGVNFIAEQTQIENNISFFKAIDIPAILIGENKSFFWNISVTEVSGNLVTILSDTFNQSVSPSNLSICGGDVNTVTVNYTYFDEQNNNDFSTVVDPGVIFEWWLGSGTVKKNASVNPSNANSHQYCINTNKSFTVDTTYSIASGGFDTRRFNFILEKLDNITKFKRIGLLTTGEGTLFTVKLVDEGALPLRSWLVQILRLELDNNEHVIVESRLTDGNGLFQILVEERVPSYQVRIFNPKGELKAEFNGQFFACLTTFCQIEFVVSDLTDPFEVFDDIPSYENSMTFNIITNTFIFSWSDGSGNSPTHRLFVENFNANDSLIICNVTSSDIVGTLSCGVGNNTNSFTAQAFRDIGSGERRVALLSVRIGDLSFVFGVEGLFWSFILLFTLVGIGSWNPPVGIVLYLAGFTLLGFFGLISMTPQIFFANLIIGVLFIWAWRG